MPVTIRRVDMPQLFQQDAGTITFAGGLPDLSVLPADVISTAANRLLRLGSRVLLQYTTPHVATRLVPGIADLAAREAMTVTAERLVPTSGSQLGLAIVSRVLGTGDGDVMLVDSPTYPGALSAFSAAGLDPVPVASDTSGPAPEALAAAVATERSAGRRVAGFYCTPTFHNPTGRTMTLERREALVACCQTLGVTIVEDNPYGLLAFDGQTWPALKSLAPDNVVYLGTFSKIFAPGTRVGWIDAPVAVVDDLRAVSEIFTLSPSALNQALIAEFHRSQGWNDLLAGYRTSYAQRAQLMSATLTEQLAANDDQGLWHWDEPTGGFYLWLQHLGGADAMTVARFAAAAGVTVVPGTHFSTGGDHRSALRLCFSNPSHADIVTGATRLASVLATAGAR